MRKEQILDILRDVREEKLPLSEALEHLRDLPFSDLDHSRVDHHRSVRTGFPEVLFCRGKTVEEVKDIGGELLEESGHLLATRVENRDQREALLGLSDQSTWHERARAVQIQEEPPPDLPGSVGIISAGTSDGKPYREAVVTAEYLGASTVCAPDSGVAGIQRLLADREDLCEARVLIVVAGMEGALPSVVGGLFDRPVVGVPSSTGYGTAFDGVTPLLSMLNSCTPSVSVVNIDNGFGAAYFACQVLRSGNRKKETGERE